MNLLTFPFYPSVEQQSRFLGCGQIQRALVTGQSRWLPFVVQVPAIGKGLDCIRIYHAESGTVYQTIPSSAFTYDAYSDGDIDYLFYYGGLVAGLNMACADYYLEANGYFSEVFSVVRDTSTYLRLEWNSAGGLYQTGFSNLLFLDCIIAEPTYKIEEDGDNDAQGNFVALRTRVEKTLKLDTALLPEFLVDALAGMALHTNKQIGRYSEVNALKVTPTWNKKGCAATVEITFTDGAAATSEGCGSAPIFQAIDLTGFVPAPCSEFPAEWVNLGPERCEQAGGKNTGWLEVQQIDKNPLSTTYNQVRWARSTQDVTACPVPAALLRSREISDEVFRTNCGPNEVGGSVTFTVPEGQFTGTDQAAIDKQAAAYFEANKEAYANENATCNPSRKVEIYEYSRAAKVIRVTLKRTDTQGDCTVGIFTQIQGDAGAGIETHQESFTKTIPAGQDILVTTLPQAGYVIYEIEQIGISTVQPLDYDF
jgi:hypothetical protein